MRVSWEGQYRGWGGEIEVDSLLSIDNNPPCPHHTNPERHSDVPSRHEKAAQGQDRPMSEEWRAIPGSEGRYEVSSEGRVRSLDRVVIDTLGVAKRRRGKLLKRCTSHGYGYVCIAEQGSIKRIKIASLVAAAFIGPKSAGMFVCHDDGDRSNDRLGNLRYDTPKSNTADMKRHGTKLEGSAVSTAKLVESQAREIRRRYSAGGVTMRELAAECGVTRSCIGFVISGKTWKHV